MPFIKISGLPGKVYVPEQNLKIQKNTMSRGWRPNSDGKEIYRVKLKGY